VLERLLAHPRHEEDVVVDPQRHEEDEGEQRERRVGAGEAEDVVEHQRADAERREERQDHRADEQQRRDDRPQQQDQHQEDHDEDRRDDDAGVARRLGLDVLHHRGAAADEHVRADLVDRRAQAQHGRLGLGAVGRGLQDRRHLHLVVDDARRRRRGAGRAVDGQGGARDAVGAGHDVDELVGRVLRPDDADRHARCRPGSGGRGPPAGHRVDLGGELLGRWSARRPQLGGEQRGDGEGEGGGHPDRPRTPSDEPATRPQIPFSYVTTSSWRGTNGKNQ
jgi:hypothetical protein